MPTTTHDFKMGADPEFICIDYTHSIVEADTILGDFNTPVGTDGGTRFEIRPQSSEEPLDIVRNIQTLLKQQSFLKPIFYDLTWLAGSYQHDHSLGGHIHFGIPKHKMGRETAIGFLDQYLGSITLLIEHRDQGLARRQTEYGGMGDYRNQIYGFEYRTPSSWITSPYVAAAILCLGKMILFESLNNPKFKWQTFAKPYHFTNMNTPYLKTKFPNIWSDITKMKLYQKYKPYVDLIYFLVTENLSWFPTTTMKNAWGVANLAKYTNKSVDLDLIWLRYKNLNKKLVK